MDIFVAAIWATYPIFILFFLVFPDVLHSNLPPLQERSQVAQKIINVIRKKRTEMIRGIERLCDAYITLAYMDASRHKTEKSECSRNMTASASKGEGFVLMSSVYMSSFSIFILMK